MKSFIFDIPKKISRLNDSVDMKAVLCNKTWLVYSDSGEKEVYIFMEDGSLVISVNGIANMGTWMYIPANKSVVLTSPGATIMAHPFFVKNLLILVMDGTSMCSFLIDQTEKELEYINGLSSFTYYIDKNTSPSIGPAQLRLSEPNQSLQNDIRSIPPYLSLGNNLYTTGIYYPYQQLTRTNGVGRSGVYYLNGAICTYKDDVVIKKERCVFKFGFSDNCWDGCISHIRYFKESFPGDFVPTCHWNRYVPKRGLFGSKTVKEFCSFETHVKDSALLPDNRSSNEFYEREQWMSLYGQAFIEDIESCKEELFHVLGETNLLASYFSIDTKEYKL